MKKIIFLKLKHDLNYGIIKKDFKIKKEESIKLNFQFLEKINCKFDYTK